MCMLSFTTTMRALSVVALGLLLRRFGLETWLGGDSLCLTLAVLWRGTDSDLMGSRISHSFRVWTVSKRLCLLGRGPFVTSPSIGTW